MRFIWMIFAGLLVAMMAVLPRLGRRAPVPAPTTKSDVALPAHPTALRSATPSAALTDRADSIVAFGLAQRGTPYVYAGTSPLTGFDCSGFIMYTFAHFGVPVPHSTALLIDVGRSVARPEARPGDIVVFTGTDLASTTPGHAGIVISRQGEVPLRFVHASSSRREPFVKVSQVENSDYERRFMQVRRVLGPGTGQATTTHPPRSATAARPPVAALRPRSVAVAAPILPVAAPPRRLAPRKLPRHSTTAHRPAAAKASAAHKKATPARKPKVAPKPHASAKKRVASKAK